MRGAHPGILWLIALGCAPLASAEEPGDEKASFSESGVTVQTLCTNCNNAALTVGGLPGEHVDMSCDGLPVLPGLDQIYLLTVLPPGEIESIAVTQGPVRASRAGRAVGGLVTLGRRELTETPSVFAGYGSGAFGWRSGHADLSMGNETIRGQLVGTWARSDRIDPNDDGNPNLPEFERWSAEGGVQIRHGENEFRVRAMRYDESQQGGRAAFDFANSTREDGVWTDVVYNLENVELERRAGHATWRRELGRGSEFAVGGLYAERMLVIDETLAGPNTPFWQTYEIDETDRHAFASWSSTVGLEWKVAAGASWDEREFGIVDTRFNAVHLLDLDTRQSETVRSTSLWTEADWTPSPRVSATLGLRWQRDEYEDDEAREAWLDVPLPEDERLLPRAALSYQVAPSWTLDASAGAGFRQPEPAFEEVCCGRRYRGNRGIRHERSRAYGFGVRYEPSPRLRVGLSGLVADFDDLVVKMVTMSFLQQVTYQNVNVESARMTTLSLNLRAEPIPRRLSLTGSYVLLDADNRSANDRILALVDRANQPAELTFTTSEIPYLATRNATLQLETRWARERLRVRASAQYTGPMTIQRFDGLNYDPQTSMDTITFVETEPFWVYNLGASIDLFGGVSLDFGVDNLTDEVQPGLDDAYTDFIWGPLRGRYAYAALNYRLEDRGR